MMAIITMEMDVLLPAPLNLAILESALELGMVLSAIFVEMEREKLVKLEMMGISSREMVAATHVQLRMDMAALVVLLLLLIYAALSVEMERNFPLNNVMMEIWSLEMAAAALALKRQDSHVQEGLLLVLASEVQFEVIPKEWEQKVVMMET
jgi:hypothetical protein